MKVKLAHSFATALGHVSIAFGSLGITSGGDPITFTASEGAWWLAAGALSLAASVALSMAMEQPNG